MAFLKAIYILLFGGAGQRLWLLYGNAIWLYQNGFNRLARLVNIKVERDYGCYLSLTAKIHPTVKFPHPVAIVIGAGAVVGEGTIIYQGVTLGGRVLGDWQKGNYPTIGKNVTLFSGAQLIGGIVVGDGATVGANSVVNKNVACKETVAGVPAQPLASKKGCDL
jgi:serine O-acetyltransferase